MNACRVEASERINGTWHGHDERLICVLSSWPIQGLAIQQNRNAGEWDILQLIVAAIPVSTLSNCVRHSKIDGMQTGDVFRLNQIPQQSCSTINMYFTLDKLRRCTMYL